MDVFVWAFSHDSISRKTAKNQVCYEPTLLFIKLTKNRANAGDFLHQHPTCPQFFEFQKIFRKYLIDRILQSQSLSDTSKRGSFEWKSGKVYPSESLSDTVITPFWCCHLAFLIWLERRDDSIRKALWQQALDFLSFPSLLFPFSPKSFSLEWSLVMNNICQLISKDNTDKLSIGFRFS